MTATIGIVGLGEIARLQLTALATQDVDVVAGVDIDPGRQCVFRDQAKPVFASPELLLDLEPELVVVATPTNTHHRMCRLIVDRPCPPPQLVVEKPLATTMRDVDDILDRSGTTQVSILYHAAHAPEVLWASARFKTWLAAHGEVAGYRAGFNDPYRDMDPGIREATFGNSWLDSGINALSIARRFVDVEDTTVIGADAETNEYEVGVVLGGKKKSLASSIRAGTSRRRPKPASSLSTTARSCGLTISAWPRCSCTRERYATRTAIWGPRRVLSSTTATRFVRCLQGHGRLR